MTLPTRDAPAEGSATEDAIRRMTESRHRFDSYFSPEITALIDRDAPEVIGGPGLPKRRLRKE
jgi:hypothetical protein